MASAPSSSSSTAAAAASSSSALVAVLSESTFTEQVVDVAALLSRSHPEAQRTEYIQQWSARAAEAEADEAKKVHVVEALVGDIKGLGEGTDRELEGVHNLVSAIIFALPDGQKSQDLAAKHIALVANDGTAAKETLKYRILSNTFNSLPTTSPVREKAFLAMLDIATSNDELDILSSALASLPSWLASWNIPESRKAAALDVVASKLEASDAEKAYRFRLAHLQYLSTTPGAATDADTPKLAAEKAISSALKLTNVFDFDSLAKLSAVDGLQRSSPAVYALLKILVQGSLVDWQSWASSNAAELARLGADAAHVERKVRLLEMASLCSKAVQDAGAGQAQGAEVPYAAIAQAIQVPEAAVESWVIDVIRAGLVSGKLSQVTATFRVYRSTYRTFGTEQWKLLEARLAEWDTTLEGVLATLSTPRSGAAQRGGGGAAAAVAAAPAAGIPGADAATQAATQAALAA